LILRGGGHIAFHRQITQIGLDFRSAHLPRVPFLVE
jgi:hypothetical protein